MVRCRTGKGAERLKHGVGPAEKLFLETVWWPGFQHFKGLHPEYEIHDFKGGYRYIDFAYIQAHFRIAIEIDGVGTHWKNISNEQFSDHCMRQNHLVIDRWHVLRFAYTDIRDNARVCVQLVQQLIGRLSGDSSRALQELKLTDKEIVRLALGSPHPISPRDVVAHLNLGSNAAACHLKRLADMKWLEPASGSIRIRSYRIHPNRSNIQL